MRFSKENQPARRRKTEDKKVSMTASVKASTKAYFQKHRGDAGKVLDEYVKDKI